MVLPSVAAEPYNPLLTYQFRVQLLDWPDDVTPEQLSSSRGTLVTPVPGSGGRGIGKGSGGYIAGVRRVSGLTVTLAATETWEGGNSLHRYANPHRAVWEPILLEQGLALDTTLQSWAEAGLEFLRSGRVDPDHPVKRNLLLDVWDPGTQGPGYTRHALRYVIFNAWVSKYQAIPRLDAMADEIALLAVELTHHGWRLDQTPTFGDTPAQEDEVSTPT